MRLVRLLIPALLALPLFAQPSVTISLKPGRDAGQPIDEEYTRKIREYTTETFFQFAAYRLPARLEDRAHSESRARRHRRRARHPAVLGRSLRYMRMLEAATPRVKVFSIGKTEEGREMIAVAVASERLIAQLDQNRARLAQLGDPRTIGFDDAKADSLVAASTPIYYITGTIHSTETGAPTALMELAYRLAVDESAYIKASARTSSR
jgi:hypothetical protein